MSKRFLAIRFPAGGRRLGEERDGVAEKQKFAVGVPLPRLLGRKLEDSDGIVVSSRMPSPAARDFRRLRMALNDQRDGGPQVVVVTSASSGDGKSVVALNLALAFAADTQGGTLLVDANLRRPFLDQLLSPAPSLGLFEILSTRADLEHGLLDIQSNNLTVLPAGAAVRDPVELLSSPSASALMEKLRARFRRIVIDTPPVVPFIDANVIGGLSDGAVFVVRAGATPRRLFQLALSSIRSTKILALVLNDVTSGFEELPPRPDGPPGAHPDGKRAP